MSFLNRGFLHPGNDLVRLFVHVKIFRIVDPQNRRSSFRGENFRHRGRVTDIAVAGAEHTLNRGIDSIEFGPAPAIEFLHVKRAAMQFFLLRKIRRRTGNTVRGPFVQTCIRPFTERAPPPPCRRLRRCQRRPARRKTRSREAGIAVFNTSSATEQREQVPPETISAGQMLPGKKLLSAKRRSR